MHTFQLHSISVNYITWHFFRFIIIITYPVVWMTAGTSSMIGQPLFSIALCPQLFEGLQPTIILSILIYYLPISFSVCLSFSVPVQCPMDHLCKSCWSCYVPIPSQFAFSHSGDKIFIRNMFSVGDAQKSFEASHFCSLYLPLQLCCKAPCFARVQKDEMTKEYTTLILELGAMFLSFHVVLSFDNAPTVWAILDRISYFNPLFIITEPKYLKLWTVSRFWPPILMSELIPLVLLIINLVFSALLSMPYVVDALSSWLANLNSSSSFPSITSAKRKFMLVLSPMLTDPSWSSKASVIILSRKIMKRVGESRHPCLTSTVVTSHSPKLPFLVSFFSLVNFYRNHCGTEAKGPPPRHPLTLFLSHSHSLSILSLPPIPTSLASGLAKKSISPLKLVDKMRWLLALLSYPRKNLHLEIEKSIVAIWHTEPCCSLDLLPDHSPQEPQSLLLLLYLF